jgi:hypothetical protein
LRTATTAEGESDHVEVGEMNETETTGIDLLLSDPRVVEWLGLEDEDERDDEAAELSLR